MTAATTGPRRHHGGLPLTDGRVSDCTAIRIMLASGGGVAQFSACMPAD